MTVQSGMTNPEQEKTFTIVAVPEHLRERVLEFMKQLDEDADTHGFIMGQGAAPGTGTNCRWTKAEGDEYEVICSDITE